MARSLSQAKRVGVLVAESISRRGYAVASNVWVRVGSGTIGPRMSVEEKVVTRDTDWVPDPITGYYRPINHTPEIDPVELRHMLLRSPH